MKIAFVIDNPDFRGGAHVATYALIERLRKGGYQVDVVSPDFPALYTFRFRVRQFFGHLHLGWFPDWTIDPTGQIRKRLAAYDVVCCLGEPSSCRKLVSNLPKNVRKVMLIHTDYSVWRVFSPLAKEMSTFDNIWYARYDCIGVVGTENARKMSEAMTKLAFKIKPFHNIFEKNCIDHINEIHAVPRIVTLMRVGDPPKKSERYLEIVKRLKGSGLKFDWHVYGNGDQLDEYRLKCKELCIDGCFHLDGYTENAMEKLAEADLMVLLSAYEGLPNTIYESFLCGTPVLSTNVGGIAEQIHDGYDGWLVDNDTDAAYEKLRDLLSHPNLLIQAQKNLIGYKYDNGNAYIENCILLGII